MRLVYSVRTAEDVIYADELGDDALLTYTREPPEGWSGHTRPHRRGADRRGRIDAAAPPSSAARTGSSRRRSQLLLAAGFEPHQVRTERFGPTG